VGAGPLAKVAAQFTRWSSGRFRGNVRYQEGVPFEFDAEDVELEIEAEDDDEAKITE
jgi:hypothetical protein